MSYCVCELLPFCAFSFVRYMQRYQLRPQPLLTLKNICRLPVRSFMTGTETHTTKQNGCPGGFCLSVKNCLWNYFAVYPTSKSCSQTFLRRIMFFVVCVITLSHVVYVLTLSRRIMLLRSLRLCLWVTAPNAAEAKWLFHSIIGIRFPVDNRDIRLLVDVVHALEQLEDILQVV